MDQACDRMAHQRGREEQSNSVDRVTELQADAIPVKFVTRDERPGQHHRQCRSNTSGVSTLCNRSDQVRRDVGFQSGGNCSVHFRLAARTHTTATSRRY